MYGFSSIGIYPYYLIGSIVNQVWNVTMHVQHNLWGGLINTIQALTPFTKEHHGPTHFDKTIMAIEKVSTEKNLSEFDQPFSSFICQV